MKRINNVHLLFLLTSLVGAAALLFGCGGSGGGSNFPVAPIGKIVGTAVKGPVRGATVTAYGIASGMVGEAIGSGTTDDHGSFSLSLGGYEGPVMLQMSGGTYVDEATGSTVSMGTGDMMTATIPSLSSGATLTDIEITPLTSMAQAMAQAMSGGLTASNITTANSDVGGYFMVGDILHNAPMNPLTTGSGTGADQDMRNYGMAIAAMSQYAKNIGMPFSSAMVTAMMQDASDGTLNGMMGGTSITMSGIGGGMMGGGSTMMQSTAGTSGLASAMSDFLASAENQSGLTAADMQTLMDKLSTSSGQLAGPGQTMMNGSASGTAFFGSLDKATVEAYAVNNGTMGARLATAMTDSTGGFTLPIGSYSGCLMLKVSDGTYHDLATGSTLTMQPGDFMTAVIPQISTGETVTGLAVTPLTSMAQERAQYMAGGMTSANSFAANAAVGSYFMVNDILTTQPIDPNVAGSGTASFPAAIDYGMAIAAMSQYAENIGLSDSAAFVTSMMQDASDGTMNGMTGDTSITMGGMGGGMMGGGNTMMQSTAGTSGLASAMADFLSSAENQSGLTAADMQTLMDQLTASNGTIQ